MGRFSSAGILLIVVNVGFLAAGALLLKFALDLKSTGWLDALDETEYKSAASTLVTAVMALGVGTIALALVGILGTTLRSRMLLMFYSGLMILAMIIFGVIGGTAFSFNSKMKKWEDATFPAETSENDFAVKFNEIYCYAQGAYFCNNATTTDLITIFFPTVPTEAVAALPKLQGLNSLCKSGSLAVLGNVDGVCAACKQAEKFAKFDKILSWADEKCPRTATTSLWCAAFLESGKPGAVYDNSPYKQCRESFLDIAISWGNSLTVYGLLSFIAAAALLALSCFARRSRHAGSDEGNYKV